MCLQSTLYLCLYLCLGSGVAAFSDDDVHEDTRYGFDEEAGGDDRALFIVSSLFVPAFIDDRALEPCRSRRFFLASSSTSRRTDLGGGMGALV